MQGEGRRTASSCWLLASMKGQPSTPPTALPQPSPHPNRAVTPAGRLEGPRPLTRNLSVPCQLVVFSPDSQRVLVASLDGAVRCYDTATARLLQLYAVGEGGQQAVVAVSWFPGSSMFLAATHKALGLWGVGLGGGAPLRRLTPPHAFLYDAAVGPCGDVIITVGQDKRIAFTRWVGGCLCWCGVFVLVVKAGLLEQRSL